MIANGKMARYLSAGVFLVKEQNDKQKDGVMYDVYRNVMVSALTC